ncbi:MAG: transketolase [Oscillospiraceae bacterium]|nr:transketolase [Oscillospiraceae bacterium]
MSTSQKEQLAVNAVRVLSMDAVQKANSGHPGLPLGSAPLAFELWARHMRHLPSDPHWLNRDRFVLSAGHGSMLLYSLLHLFGYGVSLEDLKQFRQTGSMTPGHPEYGHTPGVEATTGPLGQGVVMATGLALAEAHLSARFNQPDYPVIDHYTYALVGDGCLMEGVSSEGASLAGHLGLGKLIVLYDSNQISIEGSTSLAFTEDVAARYRAYNWQVLTVRDGNDTEEIGRAIEEARHNSSQPSLIVVHTVIGYGSPLAGTSKVHGSPLGVDNVAATRKALGWAETEAFKIPSEVYDYMSELTAGLQPAYDSWQALLQRYQAAFPELAAEFAQVTSGQPVTLPEDSGLYDFEGSVATRKTSAAVLNRLAPVVPQLLGGSADLAPSTLTDLKDYAFMSADDFSGRNIHFGVREFAMTAITNGLALHSGLRPFCSTFFVFSDYMKPAIRLAALMQLPVIYVLTHDSIGVGEDGPTHEPIEQLAMLRAIPGLYTFRPADGHETAAAYSFALSQKHPVAIVLTRQSLPTLEKTGAAAKKGAYVIWESKPARQPELILLASGSELAPVLAAAKALAEAESAPAIRVVSMACQELFLEQPAAYQEAVLPKACRQRVAVEAGSTQPWYRFTGLDGLVIGIDRFGLSGKANELFEAFGLTAPQIADQIKAGFPTLF